MCFSMGTTVAMAGLGTAATIVTIRRQEPAGIPATLAWFTLMEMLQVAGHAAVDNGASPMNQATTLCGSPLCTVSGEWHIGWAIRLNDLPAAMPWLNVSSPAYLLTVFVLPLPLPYGAWRFVLFHALVGPILAWRLAGDSLEAPAVWCLFSIGMLLIALSPWIRARFTVVEAR